MFEKALVMYIYAETPIHPGSGAVISGAVDLPIQRERHTEFPMIQGSSLKGVLRSFGRTVGLTDIDENLLFGEPETVGGLSVSDAKVLAFPVRSIKGLFGWVTCPFVLDRFKRDMVAIENFAWDVPIPSNEMKAIVNPKSNLLIGGSIYLEDIKLETEQTNKLEAIISSITRTIPDGYEYNYLKEKISRDIVIVSDDLFRDFVVMTTEVATRVRIGEEGVVKEGGLWCEEYIPTDTIMYSLILIPGRLKGLNLDQITKKLYQYNDKILHIGGDETIGKGFARLKLKG